MTDRDRPLPMTAPWEAFRDARYFDLWCVRHSDGREFGAGFHLAHEAEAIGLRDVLNAGEDVLARIRAALGLTEETSPLHARLNLDGATINIEHMGGMADAVSIRAIERVMGQLGEVERILCSSATSSGASR